MPTPVPAPAESAHPSDLSLTLDSPAQSEILGVALAQGLLALPEPGLVLHLLGDLGSGKTTIVRALLRALGVSGPIKSPTFTLMEPYVVPLPQHAGIKQKVSLYCYHFDFYRFTDPREWLDAGFREYFDDHALCLVEWPEKAQGTGRLPPADLAIALGLHGAGRRAVLQAFSTRGQACLAAAASSLAPCLPPASHC